MTPGEFAYRLSLARQAQSDCNILGCIVIEFTVDLSRQVLVAGVTNGGAREWRIQGNVHLSPSMKLTRVRNSPTGPEYAPVQL